MRLWKQRRAQLVNNFRFRRYVRRVTRIMLTNSGPKPALEELATVREATQDPAIRMLAYNLEREIRETAFSIDDFELNRITVGNIRKGLRAPRIPRCAAPALDHLTELHGQFRRSLLSPDSPLTERQLECLEWAALGKSSTDIATILGVSKRTVDEHLATTCDKLGVKTRVQAVGKLEKFRGLASTP